MSPKLTILPPASLPPPGLQLKSLSSSEPTIDDLFITEPAVIDSNEIGALKALANGAHRLCADEIPSQVGVNTTQQSNEAIGQHIDGYTHAITHEGMVLLDGYFPNSPVDLGSLDNALALDMLRLGDENAHQNFALATAQSNTSEPFTAPSNHRMLVRIPPSLGLEPRSS
jgi:hypothetical protein